MGGAEQSADWTLGLVRQVSTLGANTPDSERIGLLLVTDVRLLRDGLTKLLESDVRVRLVGSAATAEEAVAAAELLGPSVVLFDVSSPEAFAAIQSLRLAVPTAHLVAFGTNTSDEKIVAYVEAGIFGFVPRDASANELLDVVERVARGEAVCSPRAVADIMRRLTSLAEFHPSRLPSSALSGREREIIALIDSGLSNKQIAHRLQIGLATVKNHVHNILEKLNVRRRGEAAACLRDAESRGSGEIHLRRCIHD